MAKPTTGAFELERIDAQEWHLNLKTPERRIGHGSWHGMVKIYGCDESPQIGAEIAEANAILVLEAFGTYTDTGKTPRELERERDELLAAASRVTKAFRMLGLAHAQAEPIARLDCERAMLLLDATVVKAQGGGK